MKVIEDEQRVRVMEGSWSPMEVIREIVESGTQEDPFYVMDLGEVVRRYHQWKEAMPRVEPFYAVKCNDDKLLVSTLAALGAGFDCASKAEIQLITSLGVHPDRIIFANPAKMASHIRYASMVGVEAMTFDSEIELLKIKQQMPHAKLVIRIRCDADDAQCPLGIKFGCDPVMEAPRLLKIAATMKLNVIGVSFHVGSGAGETAVYGRGIQYCRTLFTLGEELGHTGMNLLDIGGGMSGATGVTLNELAEVVNASLETHFPENKVRVIAEPGRYFAAAAYTLATMIHAKREISKENHPDSDTHTMYFINDGVYGSFNCVLYDHQHVVPVPLYESSDKSQRCSIWGPTCDGLDCVLGAWELPPQPLGAWLVFRDMGAYTIPVASTFNGFPVPRVRALIDRSLWVLLKDRLPLSEAHFLCGAHMTGPQPPAPPEPSPDHVEILPLHPDIHPGVFVECALK